jgi:sec1 family domain-containing protein 1
MATPLHHTWTYQALAHDVLDLALNRVVVEENAGRSPSGGTKVKTRACDLDTGDKFWMSHKGRSVSGGNATLFLSQIKHLGK